MITTLVESMYSLILNLGEMVIWYTLWLQYLYNIFEAESSFQLIGLDLERILVFMFILFGFITDD